MNLTVVEGEVPQIHMAPSASTASGLPDFEGQPVDETRIKLTSVNNIEHGEGEFNRLDDTVRMFVEGRVVRVDHVVDNTTGKLIRVHTIKVLEASSVAWNTDNGQFT